MVEDNNDQNPNPKLQMMTQNSIAELLSYGVCDLIIGI